MPKRRSSVAVSKRTSVSRFLRVAVVLAVHGGVAPAVAPAQQPAAFSWVRFALGATSMTPNFPPGDFWQPGFGPALRVETPLDPGTLALGAHIHSASGGRDITDPAADPMRWWLLYVGWGREHTGRLATLGTEVRVGTLVNSAPEAIDNNVERELLVGGAAWIRRRLGNLWSLRGEMSVVRVYAYHPWSPVSFTASVTRRVGVGERLSASIGAVRQDAATPDPHDLPGTTPSWWASFPELPSHAFESAGVSTDRVDHFWSPGFLRAPDVGAPRYWLDGIPIRDASLGGPTWPWLPIGSPDLLRLEALDRPGILEGRPELEGALSATTRPPAPGGSARARAMILNERGDPGPLRFTALTSPNVDGPLYELDTGAGYGWTDGWLTVSAVRRERWSLTRPELRERNPAFIRAGAASRVEGMSVGAAQRVGVAAIRGRFWGSSGDRYLRTPSLGHELAADVDHRGGGLSLSLPAAVSDSVRFYVAASSWATSSPNRQQPAADPRQLAWSETDLDAGVQYRRVRGETTVVGGVDASRARDGVAGVALPRTSAAGHMSISRRESAWLLTAGTEVGGGDYGAGVMARIERALGSGAWLGGAVSWRSGGRAGGLDLWDQAVQNPVLFSMLGLSTAGLTDRKRGHRAIGRLEGGVRRIGWQTEFGIFVHQFTEELRPGVGYSWSDGVVTGLWGPLESGAGRVVGISAKLVAFGGDRVSGRVSADAIDVSGTGAFGSWWSGAPRVQMMAEGLLALRPGWALRALLHGRSGVTWAGLDQVDARGAVPGGGSVPGSLIGDIRMEGVLLRGRLRVMVGVTNVFDHDARLHPLGAGESRGLVLGVGSAVGGY